MKLGKKVWIFIALAPVLIAVIAAIVLFYFSFFAPTGELSEPVVVMIEKGDTLSGVAGELGDLGAIKNEKLFITTARVIGAQKRIRAGEYEITPDMSPNDILILLLRGEVIEYSVVVPEGYNIYQVSKLLADKGLIDEDTFLGLLKDEDFISSLNIDADVLEGYLFPDTYNFNRGMSEGEIIKKMVDRYYSVLDEEEDNAAYDADTAYLSEYEVLVLASIIEKEASAEDERPLVSAVFVNRLEKGMKLDSCATVIYGMWDRFDGNLKKTDLETYSDYNTYIIAGLPPSPICNPGRAAIRAALSPADVDYLYFVSKNDGTHHFSSTLAEHNRAVYKYQKLRTYR
jgi:UPF0755 protein